MNRTRFAPAALLLLTAAAVGQESAPPPRAKASDANESHKRYRIDFKIVYGEHVLERRFPRRSMISGFDPSLADDARAPENAAGPNTVWAKESKSATYENLWQFGEHDADAKTLAAPTIITTEDTAAIFLIKNKKTFDYLVPEGKQFRSVTTPPQELGLTVECTVRTVSGEPDVVELAPLKISQATLDGREPIAGLDLDVGKPIISKRTVETTARCLLGQARYVPIATTQGRQALLLVRVSRFEE